MFDADRAGVAAVLRSGTLAREQSLRPHAVLLPAGMDPADAVKLHDVDGVKRLVGRRMSLLAFEVRRVLEQHDTGSSEGRVRAFEALRGVLDQASSPQEREEEVRTIAERLRMSEDVVAGLLTSMGGGRAAVARRRLQSLRGAERAPRLDDSPHARRLMAPEPFVEREFLAAAVCNPAPALTFLDELRPEHFVDPANREAFLSLRRALEADDPSAVLRELARGEGDASRLFVRLAFECDEARYTPSVLGEFYYRLQDGYLTRKIAPLRERLQTGEITSEEEHRLFKLEVLRQEIRTTMLDKLEEG
jgi:DNA primase